MENGSRRKILKANRDGGVNGAGGLVGSNGRCAVVDQSTEELLHSFRNGGGQAAFEEIVRRYAGMVYSVCLQVTRDVHDAEDATQAAFLTLALRAKTSEQIKYLGPWLQKVARRLSLDIMRANKRRKKREERRGEMVGRTQPNGDPRHGLDRAELADIVRDELGKLPSKYRLPLILHYFGGLRPEEVARELGFKPSTLGVRLHRGRKMLADNLAERGVTLTNAMLASILAGVIHTGISDNLVAQTSLAAAGLSFNGDLPGAVISARVVALTRHAASAVFWAKAKAIVGSILVASVALAGGAQVARTVAPGMFDWRLSDLTRIIRPLLRSILPQPRAQLDVRSPRPDTATVSSDRRSDPLRPGLIETESHTMIGVQPEGLDRPWADAFGLVVNPTMPFDSVDPNSLRQPLRESFGAASFTVAQAGAVPPDPPLSLPVELALAPARPPAPAGSGGFSIDPSSRTAFHLSGAQRYERLAVDSWPGSTVERYVLGPGARLAADTLTIGGRGSGVFEQRGGDVQVAGRLALGGSRGSSGTYHLEPGGGVQSQNLAVGVSGSGRFVQTGGHNTTRTLDIAVNRGAEGEYAMADGVLSAETINVGVGGRGQFVQEGGTVLAGGDLQPGTITVGLQPGGDGAYVMAGERIETDKLAVGDRGNGTFVQHGGVTSVREFFVGHDRGSRGWAALDGGLMPIQPHGQIVIGNRGSGTVVLGDTLAGSPTAASPGAAEQFRIYEEPPDSGATLRIRTSATGQGLLRGFGEVHVTGPIVQNGQVIAERGELDLSTANRVTNTIENPEEDGRNGWWARRGGSLSLPPIAIDGDRTSTWGEDPNDPMLDLVNSVRFTVRGVSHPGEATLALLSTDHEQVPALPDGQHFIGLWSFDRQGGLDFTDGSLLVRYDDALVQQLGADEMDVRMWTFADGWELTSAVHDPLFNLVAGRVDGDFRLFGVSLPDSAIYLPAAVPEPSAAIGIAVALGGTLLRRRR